MIPPKAIGAALALLTSPLAASANPLSFSNKEGGTFTFYGQVSPAYVGFSDGAQNYGNLTDNTCSNTRAGVTFEQVFDNPE